MSGSWRAPAVRSILPLLLAAVFVGPARAVTLAFDFDTDGDPTTVDNTVDADIDEVVEAYLVLGSTPVDRPWLRAVQFGIELTAGLELVGMDAPQSGALYIQDGVGAIAVAFGAPVNVANAPVFVMRFVFQVTGPGPQSVEVVPSIGFGHEEDALVLVLSETPFGPEYTVRSYLALLGQQRGLVNAEATPTEVRSWSYVKEHFARDGAGEGE